MNTPSPASRRFLPRLAAGTFAALILAGPAARGQQPPPPPASSPAPAAGKGHAPMDERLAALTPEERDRVQTARRTARQDPNVQAAMAQREADPRAFRRAMQEAMLKADPTLAPVLAKLRPERPGKGGSNPGQLEAGPGHGAKNPNLANLSPEEQTKLQAAQQAARRDPAVIAARQQVQSATTPEARRAAREGMREAVRSAMLRSDPGVGSILDKAGPLGRRGGGPGRAGA